MEYRVIVGDKEIMGRCKDMNTGMYLDILEMGSDEERSAFMMREVLKSVEYDGRMYAGKELMGVPIEYTAAVLKDYMSILGEVTGG